MNERIREIAEQAEEYAFDKLNKLQGPVEMSISRRVFEQSFREKFAELIVRDCLDIAFEVRGKPATDTHYVIGYDRACEKMFDAIKESYGVEE